MFSFIYTEKIQHEKYKLKCYVMKNDSLSIIISYIDVNQTRNTRLPVWDRAGNLINNYIIYRIDRLLER